MEADTVLAQVKEEARLERAAKRAGEDQLMPRSPQETFLLGGVSFVPHYTLPEMFVAPGNRMHSKEYLLHLGAVSVERSLWVR